MKSILSVFLLLCLTLSIKAQTVANGLPKTWELQTYNSIIRTTLHEDGRLTSETLFGCFTAVVQECVRYVMEQEANIGIKWEYSPVVTVVEMDVVVRVAVRVILSKIQ